LHGLSATAELLVTFTAEAIAVVMVVLERTSFYTFAVICSYLFLPYEAMQAWPMPS